MVTGVTRSFGQGTLTTWSDGTMVRSRPFGSGQVITQTAPGGKVATAVVLPFGQGTVTRWSDGSKTIARPHGQGTIRYETPAKRSR